MDKPFDLLKSHESGVFFCQMDVCLLIEIIKENWTCTDKNSCSNLFITYIINLTLNI